MFSPRGDGGAADRARSLAASLPATALIDQGPLTAFHSPLHGPPARGEAGQVAALLEGHVDAEEVARVLGLGEPAPRARMAAVGYRERGRRVLDALRGRFVLLAWDAESRSGILAEDHLGNQPLFVSERGGELLFATELPALLRLHGREPEVDERGVVQWLVHRQLPEGTLLEGVERLGGGRLIELSAHGWRRSTYWSPVWSGVERLDRSDAADALREGIERSVRRWSAGGHRAGLLLSGGFDSGTIAAFSRRARPDLDLNTYSAVFPDEPDVDEGPLVERLAAALRLPSTRAGIEPAGALAAALAFQDGLGVPLRGPGLVERALLDLVVGDGIGTVIDGQGGDELFGHSPYLVADLLRRGRPRAARALTRRFPGVGGHAAWKTRILMSRYGVGGAVAPSVQRIVRSLRGTAGAPDWLRPEHVGSLPRIETDRLWQERSGAPRWWSWLAWTLTTGRAMDEMPDYIVRRARLVGLDARTPFLDVDLVESVLRVPPEHAFDPLLDRRLARDATRGLLPDEIRLRATKSNYAGFIHEVLAGGDLPLIRTLLEAPDAHVRRYVTGTHMDRLLAAPPRRGDPGWSEWGPHVWSLVTTECWLRGRAGQKVVEDPPPGWGSTVLADAGT